jgi:uncharacterized membrane protein
VEALPADALKDAGQRLLGLLVQRSAEAATQRVNGWAVRLSDVTESGGDFRAALREKSQGDGQYGSAGGLRGALRGALSGVKEKVKRIFGGSGAEERGRINLLEGVEVGLPVGTTYDAWTQFASFPSFNRLETAGLAPDRRTNWMAKLLGSREPGDTTIIEQVPDSRIVWRSAGAHGHVDGAVSFTQLGPDRTQVLLVLEWPKGLFGRTGNLWPARARRVRLDLEHFHRQAMARALVHQREVRGWRGEVRDGEVVKNHEEAAEQEEPTPERVAEDESAVRAEGEYVAADEGEQAQIGEDEPWPVGSGRRG